MTVCKVLTFRGRVRSTGKAGYATIYVYTAYGGEELAKHIGEEVEGLVIIREGNKNTTDKKKAK